MPLTLAELLTPRIRDIIRASYLSRLEAAGFPVDDWSPASAGGIENSLVDMAAGVLAERAGKLIPQMVAGRFLDLQPRDAAYDPALASKWLRYLAKHFYGIDFDEATKTVQNIRLTSAATAPPNTFQVGDIVISSPATGNRYRSIEGGSLPAGSTLDLLCEAEAEGSAYDDGEDTVTQLITAFAGVTGTNIRPADFTDQVVTGVSSGTIIGHFDSVPEDILGARVRVDVTGEVGSGRISFSTDGGATWTPAGAIPTHLRVNFPGFGFDKLSTFPEDEGQFVLTFTNGAAPSFVEGDIFTLLVGEAIQRRGTDEESDESIRTKCRSRWATLSDVPTEAVIVLWAQLASTEIAKVSADADPHTPGGILVTVASESGPASARAVIAVTDFIAARMEQKGMAAPSGFFSPEEKVLVRSARRGEVLAAGLVDVPRARVREVQQAAETNWTAYLRSVDIGGTVRLSELQQAVMDAGARNFTGTTPGSLPSLNGDTENVVLEADEVAVEPDGSTLLTALVWRPV